jgi:cytochrome b
MKSILVWDIPTRLFHWLFALSFAVAYVTAEADGWAGVHVFSGLLMLGLIALRVIWGVLGSRYARFSSFLFSPVAAFKYLLDTLRGKAERHVGHNPAGSWAIYLLLLLGVGTSVSGLSLLVVGEQFEDVHEALANGALAIVVVHVIGVIAASFLHRENLPRAMVTGYKEGDEHQAIRSSRPVSAIVLLALVTAFSAVYWKGWDAQTQSVTLPFLSQPLALGEHDRQGETHGEHDDD